MANYLFPSIEALIHDIEGQSSRHFQDAERIACDSKIPPREREASAAIRRASSQAYRAVASQLRASMIGEGPHDAVPLSELSVATPPAEAREAAIAAVFKDIRDRKLLKYLFESEPANVSGYGHVDTPLDLETQRECVEAWVDAITAVLATPARL